MGLFEASIAGWLKSQLFAEAESAGKRKLSALVRGDPVDSALDEALRVALELAVRHAAPEGISDKRVAHAVAVLLEVWERPDLVTPQPAVLWLDRVHQASTTALAAIATPHGVERSDGVESSWDLLVNQAEFACGVDDFAELVTAMLVETIITRGARPDSALRGIGTHLARAVDEHLADRRVLAVMARVRSLTAELPGMLDAALERNAPRLAAAIVDEVRRELPVGAISSGGRAAAGGVVENLPRTYAPRFVGRTSELAVLARRVGDQTVVGQVLEGVGGIGKTRLALEYASQCARGGENWSIVWWISAATDTTTEETLGRYSDVGSRSDAAGRAGEVALMRGRIVDGIVELGRRCGVISDGVDDGHALTCAWLAQSEGAWLLVVDNVDEPASVVGALPTAGEQDQVLVTSRARGWAGVGIVPITLHQLGDDDAVELFAQLAGDHHDLNKTRELAVDVLGGHALAISQAGAHIDVHGFDLDAYITMLATAPAEGMFGSEQPGDYHHSVYDVHAVTIQAVGDDADVLLGRLAWLDPDHIAGALVRAVAVDWDEGRRSEAVNRLVRHRLIDRTSSGYQMHRVTRHLASRRHVASQSGVLAIIAELFPDDTADHTEWPVAAALETHVIATAWAPPSNPADSLIAARLLNNLGNFQLRLARTNDAEASQRRALEIFEAVCGPDHPEVARTVSNLGIVQQSLGRFVDAEASQQRALEIYEEVYGPDHPESAITLGNLGNVQNDLGRLDEAEASHLRALDTYELVFGSDHPEVARALTNLGNVQNQLGRLEDAEASQQRALGVSEEILGPSHPEVARILNNLGNVQENLGRFVDAEASQRRALMIFEAVDGSDHPEVARTLTNLGNTQQKLGRFVDAEASQRRALDIYEEAYGSNHPEVARTLGNLGITQRQMGLNDDAEASQQRALALKQVSYGPAHPEVARTLGNLGLVQQDLGRVDDAEASQQRALAIFEAAYGPEHPDVANALRALGVVQRELGRAGDAETNLRRALKLFETTFGSDHTEVAVTLAMLSNVQRQMGRFSAAEASLERAVRVSEVAYPDGHPHRVMFEKALAVLRSEPR